MATKLRRSPCLWAGKTFRRVGGENTKERSAGVKLRWVGSPRRKRDACTCSRRHAQRRRGSSRVFSIVIKRTAPRLLIQQLISHLIYYVNEMGKRFLAGTSDMEDTERIPWKSTQSRPSAGAPASRGGVDAAGAALSCRSSEAASLQTHPCYYHLGT